MDPLARRAPQPYPPLPEPPKRESGLLTRTWRWIQSHLLSPINKLLEALTQRLLRSEPEKPKDLKGRVSSMPLPKSHPLAPKPVATLTGAAKPTGELPAVSPELLQTLRTYLQAQIPEVQTHQYGYGIENGGNSCYVNSIAQGLRAVASFRRIRDEVEPAPLPAHIHQLMQNNPYTDLREFITKEDRALIQDHLKSYLFQMFDALDGPNGQNLTRDDSNTLRHLAMSLGFPAQDRGSQEDAQALLLFILDEIGVPPPTFRKEILHEVGGATIPALERQSGREMCLTLDISENIRPGTSIQDLLTSRVVQADFEPHRAEMSTPQMMLPGIGKLDLTEEVRAELKRSQPVAKTTTLQSIQIADKRAPSMLLLSLKRYGYDPKSQRATKLTTPILPSEDVYLPHANDPTKVAHYKLRAVTVHDDWGTRSINGGHYYTYAPKEVDGKKMWFEYNDARVTRHEDRGPYNDAVRNGYVYFYELVKD